MRPSLDYHRVRKSLARHLLRNAEAHETGSWTYLDKGYEELERSIPREGYPEIETLLVALDFWGAWIAASRAGWRVPGPVGEADWPRLARRIVAALESDLEITDPVILSEFGPRRPVRQREVEATRDDPETVESMQLEMITREASGERRRVPLLLLHGAWHAASVWNDYAGLFVERGYTVHAMSLPAHGRSPGLHARMNYHSLGDYVAALHEAVGRISPTPVVVAHSMGGAIVQKYLEKQSLPAAVLLAPIPTWGLVPTMTRLLLRHPRITVKALGLRPYEFVRDPKVARRLMIGDSNPMDFESIHAELGDESYLVFLQLMSPFHLRSSRIGSPILLVAGGKDRLFSPWEHRQTRSRIPGSAWHFEPEDAHELMCEPGFPRVVERIDAWLEEIGLT